MYQQKFQNRQSYMQENQDDTAILYFTKILVDYPKSIYYEEARKLIRILRDKKINHKIK